MVEIFRSYVKATEPWLHLQFQPVQQDKQASKHRTEPIEGPDPLRIAACQHLAVFVVLTPITGMTEK
jgi:hypothetical protein